MNSIVIAPHPDDEVLGAGGTMLRHKAEGDKVAWLIVTNISTTMSWSDEKIKQRADKIHLITDFFGFDSVFELNFPTTQLDQVPMSKLVQAISNVFKSFEPENVFLPLYVTKASALVCASLQPLIIIKSALIRAFEFSTV